MFWGSDLNEVTYTRVGLMSKVASLFEPLGFAVPMTVKGKIELRELGIKGLKWNDVVIGEDQALWENGIPPCCSSDICESPTVYSRVKTK